MANTDLTYYYYLIAIILGLAMGFKAYIHLQKQASNLNRELGEFKAESKRSFEDLNRKIDRLVK